mmetsp:Transcript_162374/g.515888  ORF Transcript_162374/g.515888 Transcript_162374/m.515888 type:complete len:439 (-) Transcript_162374:3-1319(-)
MFTNVLRFVVGFVLLLLHGCEDSDGREVVSQFFGPDLAGPHLGNHVGHLDGLLLRSLGALDLFCVLQVLLVHGAHKHGLGEIVGDVLCRHLNFFPPGLFLTVRLGLLHRQLRLFGLILVLLELLVLLVQRDIGPELLEQLSLVDLLRDSVDDKLLLGRQRGACRKVGRRCACGRGPDKNRRARWQTATAAPRTRTLPQHTGLGNAVARTNKHAATARAVITTVACNAEVLTAKNGTTGPASNGGARRNRGPGQLLRQLCHLCKVARSRPNRLNGRNDSMSTMAATTGQSASRVGSHRPDRMMQVGRRHATGVGPSPRQILGNALDLQLGYGSPGPLGYGRWDRHVKQAACTKTDSRLRSADSTRRCHNGCCFCNPSRRPQGGSGRPTGRGSRLGCSGSKLGIAPSGTSTHGRSHRLALHRWCTNARTQAGTDRGLSQR